MLERNLKYIYYTAIILFLLSGLYGLLLRWNFAYPISGFAYDNVLQSHSHVAFLGWGFIASAGAIFQLFLKQSTIAKKRIYLWSLLVMSISIFLMLISFPLGGYKVFSIVLLSLFGLVSYVFFYNVLKDLSGNGIAIKFIRWGIYYYILSSLATWFLAGVMVTEGRTDLYYNTVYFYLHFLYNGYFVFVLFGFLLKFIDLKAIPIKNRFLKPFFLYLNVACIPTYALSVLWSDVGHIFYIVGFAGAILQCVALLFLFLSLNKGGFWQYFSFIEAFLLKFVLLAFSLKIVLQLLSSFPYFVEKSIALKPYFIIGYLHLFTLAFMSVFIILILKLIGGLIINSKLTTIGIWLFLVGVVFTESLLFMQGFLLLARVGLIDYYNSWLLLCSLILVSGMCFLFIPQLSNKLLRPKSFCQ